MYQPRVRRCLFWLFVSLALPGYSLPSDKEQVIQMVSDAADLNQKDHKGTYTGNVQLIQGTTNLTADKAVTLGNLKNQLTLAIANGTKNKQAHFSTQTKIDGPLLHAYADTIRYYPLRHLIELIGHAHVEQEKNSLSAAKISYDTIKQQVLSQGDLKTRTTIILYPEKK